MRLSVSVSVSVSVCVCLRVCVRVRARLSSCKDEASWLNITKKILVNLEFVQRRSVVVEHVHHGHGIFGPDSPARVVLAV